MKTIKATRHEQAVKELNALDKSLARKLKSMINHIDRFAYHAILIKVKLKPGAIKNTVVMNVQKYAKHGWEKISKGFAFQGFTNVILLHDPSLMDEKQGAQVPQHIISQAKSEAKKDVKSEMEAEVNKRVQEKMDAYKKEQKELAVEKAKEAKEAKKPKPDVKELTDDQKIEALENDYTQAMAGNMPELKAFMTKYGIPAADLTNNEGRQKRIKSWFEAEMENHEEDVEEVESDDADKNEVLNKFKAALLDDENPISPDDLWMFVEDHSIVLDGAESQPEVIKVILDWINSQQTDPA